MDSPTKATSLVPSADDAIACQPFVGALACVHVAPELVEVKIAPLSGVPPQYSGGLSTTAVSRLPSADDATEAQALLGAAVAIQVAPELVEV
jgi:hypothetical protein